MTRDGKFGGGSETGRLVRLLLGRFLLGLRPHRLRLRLLLGSYRRRGLRN